LSSSPAAAAGFVIGDTTSRLMMRYHHPIAQASVNESKKEKRKVVDEHLCWKK